MYQNLEAYSQIAMAKASFHVLFPFPRIDRRTNKIRRPRKQGEGQKSFRAPEEIGMAALRSALAMLSRQRRACGFSGYSTVASLGGTSFRRAAPRTPLLPSLPPAGRNLEVRITSLLLMPASFPRVIKLWSLRMFDTIWTHKRHGNPKYRC